MRISDWSSDVCSSDLCRAAGEVGQGRAFALLRKAAHAGQNSAQPAIAGIVMESLMPILLHGEAWKGDGRLENADALGVQQAGKAGGRGQDQFRLLGDRKSTRLNSSH